jgi:hypothetical protein
MAALTPFCPCFRFGRLWMGTTVVELSSMVMIVEGAWNEKNAPRKMHVDFYELGK